MFGYEESVLTYRHEDASGRVRQRRPEAATTVARDAVAGYGAYKALQAGKLTPHALAAIAGFLVAIGPEL
jgi:hypothetical protein